MFSGSAGSPVSPTLAEDPTDYDMLQLNALLPTFIRLMAR